MAIQTIPEQEQASKKAIFDAGMTSGFVCLGYCRGPGKWSWIVDRVTAHSAPADEWWKRETGLARVYGVNRDRVWIRNAK